jgi:predicted MPP superfamily phosphohydrolase
MRFDSILVSAAYNLSGAWLGMFLYLAIIMVIFEIINLIYRLPRVKAGWMVIVLAAAISAYALFNAASFKIAEITIPIKGLENEVKIMLITDVHLGASRGESYLADIVKRTNELNPDFVVLAGDIVDSKVALRKNMLAPLKDLQSPGFFVYGNHDVYVGLDKVIQSMEENGIKVMQNDVLVVNGITLIGLNYMIADESVYDPHRVTDETIKDVLPTLDLSGENPKIVLHHGPWGIEYMNEYGVNLVLTGHTHAGQMFPINHIVKTIFPYDKGLIEYNGTYMYISQGAGTFMSRMRLGTNNEINFITLEPSR